MKSKKYTIFSLIVVVFGLFALTACGGKSIQSDLKSHDWIMEREKSDEHPSVHFTEDKMTVSLIGINIVGDYELKDNKLIITGKSDGETEKQEFTIKKEKDSYKLSPINETAKEESGKTSLIPK